MQSEGNIESPNDSGLYSYRFDPNSIPQNEKILQLFLRLASHTAGRIYFLKQKTLEEQLNTLKENEKITEASKSDINIKNIIEAMLRIPSVLAADASNPLLDVKKNINPVDNTIPAELNANSTTSHFYQIKNPVPQNNFQNSGTKSSPVKMNIDSKGALEDFGNSMEVQNRLLVENDKNNKNSQLGGPNFQNSGPIPNHSGSSNQSGLNSNKGESLSNQQNSNPNNQQSSDSNNQQNSNPNNQQSSNSKNQQNSNPNSSGNIQMGQDPGSIITKVFNPATLSNMNPLNMVSNVPVIGSGLSGPINIVQDTFSKFGSFSPQLRALPETEDETNASVQESLKEENVNPFQNSTIIENNYPTPEKIPVTKEASFTNQNDIKGTAAESTSSLDNKNTFNNSNVGELNSIWLKKDHQRVDEIDDKIKNKSQDVNDKQNKKNNRGVENSKLKLQKLNAYVMKALQDMQKKVDRN